LLLNGELRNATLGVTDGSISHIVDASVTLDAEERVALDGEVVLPGLVDGHVHFREPGYTEKEGVETGTAAAAAGGVTTVVEMPNTVPPVLTVDRFESKADIFRSKSHVDFALFGAITEENVGTGDIAALADAGATAFKTFMATSFGPLLMDDKGGLYRAFEEVADVDRPLYIHAEDEEYLDLFRGRATEEHGEDMAAFFAARPPIAETTAVSDVLDIVADTGTETIVVHTTTAEAIDRMSDAKADDQPVWTEVTPYHLAFNQSDIERVGPHGIGTPPARDEANRVALWERVTDGAVDLFGSDHAPHQLAEKERPPTEVAPGMPQLETALPFLLDAVNRGRLSLSTIAEAYAERPARIHGLYPEKGSLQVGADADFVVVDMDEEWTVDAEAFESAGNYSPFDGTTLTGKPKRTYQRGTQVAADMAVTVDAGHGRFLTPEERD
jgi:dihydroorotase (multifunctional complex type)